MFRLVPELTALSIFVNLASAPVARHGRFIPEDTFCRREDTVRKLFHLLISERVIQVRGTPIFAVLATLLFNYIVSEKQLYEPVYSRWQLYGEGSREKAPWVKFLCANPGGIVNEETSDKSDNVIVMVDEAQLSYITLSASTILASLLRLTQSPTATLSRPNL
jgi:hypothetical protein